MVPPSRVRGQSSPDLAWCTSMHDGPRASSVNEIAESIVAVGGNVSWRTEEACARLVECTPHCRKASFLKGLSMARGRTTAITIHLTPQERQTLLAWQRSTTMTAGRARRARIILLVAEGMPLSYIADKVGLSRRFVYKWVKRFLHEGVAGLIDRRPGHPEPSGAREGHGHHMHHGEDTTSTGTYGIG